MAKSLVSIQSYHFGDAVCFPLRKRLRGVVLRVRLMFYFNASLEIAQAPPAQSHTDASRFTFALLPPECHTLKCNPKCALAGTELIASLQ